MCLFSLFQSALLTRYRPPDDDHGVFQMMALSVVCLIFLLVGIVFVLRILGRIALGIAQTGVAGTWNLAADLVRNMDRDFSDGLDVHLGAEYRPTNSPWAGRLGQMWRGDNRKDYQSLGVGYNTDALDLGYAVQMARQDRSELLHLLSVSGSF